MGNSNTAINEFSGNTTAEQAARNADLTGKWAIVTGCSAGIGVETVRVLLMHNCNVVMACRDEQKMAKVAQELSAANKGTGKLEQMQVELSSLKSVRKFAQDFIAKKLPIHLLILNAGVMACPYKKTEDGFEMQIGTNHLGHMALTMELLPVLKQSAPARVIAVSSLAHSFANLNLDDLFFEKTSYGTGWTAYGNSKFANVLFARELNKRLQGTNVTAYSLHPGAIVTELQRHSTFSNVFMTLFPVINKTIPQGAATTVYIACAPDSEILPHAGKYFDDCNPKAVSGDKDDAFVAKFFDMSLQLTNSKM